MKVLELFGTIARKSTAYLVGLIKMLYTKCTERELSEVLVLTLITLFLSVAIMSAASTCTTILG